MYILKVCRLPGFLFMCQSQPGFFSLFSPQGFCIVGVLQLYSIGNRTPTRNRVTRTTIGRLAFTEMQEIRQSRYNTVVERTLPQIKNPTLGLVRYALLYCTWYAYIPQVPGYTTAFIIWNFLRVALLVNNSRAAESHRIDTGTP